MRFHLKSVLNYLEPRIPYDVGFVHQNFVVHLFSPYPLKQEFLQEVVTESVIKSLFHPLHTWNKTEEQALIKTPSETHIQALEQALQQTGKYIKIYREESERGEKVNYEYQIDLRVVRTILCQVRFEEDKKLVARVLEKNYYVPLRMLQKSINIQYGTMLSMWRLCPVMKEFEREGKVSTGDGAHYRGREVLC